MKPLTLEQAQELANCFLTSAEVGQGKMTLHPIHKELTRVEGTAYRVLGFDLVLDLYVPPDIHHWSVYAGEQELGHHASFSRAVEAAIRADFENRLSGGSESAYYRELEMVHGYSRKVQ